MKVISSEKGTCFENTKDRVTLFELVGLTAPIEDQKCSIALTRLDEKGQIAMHYHLESEEIYIVTKGSGTMVVNGETFKIETGDTVVIHPEDTHSLFTGENECIEFYALTIPPFVEADYITV